MLASNFDVLGRTIFLRGRIRELLAGTSLVQRVGVSMCGSIRSLPGRADLQADGIVRQGVRLAALILGIPIMSAPGFGTT